MKSRIYKNRRVKSSIFCCLSLSSEENIFPVVVLQAFTSSEIKQLWKIFYFRWRKRKHDTPIELYSFVLFGRFLAILHVHIWIIKGISIRPISWLTTVSKCMTFAALIPLQNIYSRFVRPHYLTLNVVALYKWLLQSR